MGDEAKGKMDNIKGRVKEAAGDLTGDKKLEAEGKADRIKGATEEKVGEAKKKIEETKTEAEEEADDEDL